MPARTFLLIDSGMKKAPLILCLLLAFSGWVSAVTPEEIKSARLKYDMLEFQSAQSVQFSSEQLQEYHSIIGFLFLNDPYWRLQQELRDQLLLGPENEIDIEKKALIKEALAACFILSEELNLDMAKADTQMIRAFLLLGDNTKLHEYIKKRTKENK